MGEIDLFAGSAGTSTPARRNIADEHGNFPDPLLELEVWGQRDYHRPYLPKQQKGDGAWENMQAKVPPELAHIMKLVRESPRTPYQSMSDLIRDAVGRLMSLLAEQLDSPELAEFMDLQRALSDQAREVEFLEMQEKAVEDWRQAYTDRVDRNKVARAKPDWIGVCTLIRHGWSMVERLRDPYATELRDLVREARDRVPTQYSAHLPQHPKENHL